MRHAKASARAAATLFAEAESTLRTPSIGTAGVASDAAGGVVPSRSAARRARRKANKNTSPIAMETTSVAALGVGNGSLLRLHLAVLCRRRPAASVRGGGTMLLRSVPVQLLALSMWVIPW